MAGKGPIPKPDNRRARGNKGKASLTVVMSDPVAQPELPATMPGGDPWPAETLGWWEMWGDDPLSSEFRAPDWEELKIAALIHAELWSGNTKLAGELRLRTAKFGATAEDRARLRIQYAQADEADEKRRTSRTGADARGRYKGLKAIDPV